MALPNLATPHLTGSRVEPAAASTPLRGRWLLTARVAWLVIAGLTLGLFVASIATRLAVIHAWCPTAECRGLALGPITRDSLRTLGLPVVLYASYDVWLDVIFVVVYGTVAAVLFARRSDDRMALFASLALLLFGAATFTGVLTYLAGAYPVWRVSVASIAFLGSAAFIVFLYVLPDGRFVPRWTRWVALGWNIQQFFHNFFAGSVFDSNTWPLVLSSAPWVVFVGTVVYAQVYRYRHVSSPVQRLQTRWVILGIVVGLLGLFIGEIVASIADQPPLALAPAAIVTVMVASSTAYLAMMSIPITIAIALLRYHLFDVDLLIKRALVYAALTAMVVVVYVLIVGSLSVLFQVRGNPIFGLLATGVVAVAFQPLRERLQRRINRLLFGQRDEPYAVLSRLGQRLDATLAPDDALPTIVETVAQALKLPYAAIALKEGDTFVTSATSGVPAGEPLVLPLNYQTAVVGQLMLSPRTPGDAFTTADRRLLDDLAHQAGVVVYAVGLNVELRRARERLVLAREEERRRLRHDLHDGLGPQLASQALTLSAAARLLRQDPDTAEALLTDARTHAQEAIADIRRVVYALRPPALDDLGLVAALREQFAQYHASGVRFTLDAPEPLPLLPAAVEVACYRIAQEALTNVVRHADAHVCQVELTVGATLRLDIRDDGRGLPAEPPAGVGLTSMRERAAELGGTCAITAGAPAGDGSGTRVHVELPLG